MVDSSSQPTKSRRSFVWRIVRVALITYIALLVLMMLMENQLIYFPAKYPAGDWLPAGLPVEDAEMQAADGTRLHGWYIPHAEPRAVVLFLHGNAGNIAGRTDFLRSLRDLRLSVLALDYRGYGRSEGSPSEAGLMDDARTARRWLAERRKSARPTLSSGVNRSAPPSPSIWRPTALALLSSKTRSRACPTWRPFTTAGCRCGS